jgi:hypothetical protein
VFDELRARLERLLADAPADSAARAATLRAAAIEAKLGVRTMRDALEKVERELAAERQHLDDARRRGAMATEIGDAETAGIAERFAGRHEERVRILEQKVTVQRDELALAERDLAEMTAAASPAGEIRARAASSLDEAWRSMEEAGGVRPETDLGGDLDRLVAERRLHEEAVAAQLAHLKKKLGKTDASQ